MGDEGAVTIGKDTIYGSIIVLLAVVLVASVFTQGFGIVKAECPDVTNVTQCPDGVQLTNDSGDNATDQPGLPQLTVEFGNYPSLGDENAHVAMVEFSDYQCPFCARLALQGEEQVRRNYVDTGKVKLYFRDYPIPGHQLAGYAAVAATCANDQGKFWEMHDKLFADQGTWSESEDVHSLFKEYAVDLGLDNETFSTCYDNQTHVEDILADLEAGQDYGVGGTPASFLIIPKSMVGSDFIDTYEELREQYKYQHPYTGEWIYPIALHEDDDDYALLIGGAYPYEVFDAFLSKVDY